jgi:predicted lipid-binding transport protein (Tim44 family)
MKNRRAQLSPTLLGGLFFGIALAGVLFLDWGELRLAFLLLVYCLLIIGSRLDQIADLLERIDRRMAAAGSPGPDKTCGAHGTVPEQEPPP